MSDLLNRRSFIQLGGAACAAGAIGPASRRSILESAADMAYPIRLGKVAWVNDDQTADSVIKEVQELGLRTCQIGFEHLSTNVVAPLLAALEKYSVEATSISEHNPGRRIFDFYQGPLTIGVVPPGTRAARIQALKIAADVASLAGIPAIHTHCGFIPEDPNDPLYPQAVEAVKEVASHCKQRGVVLLCETGQETPITLVRMIDDVNLRNVFVNLDLANLILYGKGNPVDAMDVFGDRVRGIHAKDGKFPTNPKHLGAETPIGEGKVDFPRVFEVLKKVGYKGSMMIEREVGNEVERRTDIIRSKKFLERLILKTYG